MLRIALPTPPTHDLPAVPAHVSHPSLASDSFAAGPGVLLVLMLIAVLLIGVLGRAIAALWILMRSMLALLGGLALALAAMVVLANLILSNSVGPNEQGPRPPPPATPRVAPTQLAQAPGSAATQRIPVPTKAIQRPPQAAKVGWHKLGQIVASGRHRAIGWGLTRSG